MNNDIILIRDPENTIMERLSVNTITNNIYHSIKGLINNDKCVISLYGGSGSGKSTIARILKKKLEKNNHKVFILTGDNYPRLIPSLNDAKRIEIYNEKGINGLRDYLGSDEEIDYDLCNKVLKEFKDGCDKVTIKEMGRTNDSIRYVEYDFTEIDILILEWTHGNNERLKYIDIPVFLDSTPEETMAIRVKRAKDDFADSPFVSMVLHLEQELLHSEIDTAKVIVSLEGNIISRQEYLRIYHNKHLDIRPMLNLYPDSMGSNLGTFNHISERFSLNEVFKSIYILPSLYHHDLDRGFCVQDYDLNEELVTIDDLRKLEKKGYDLKLDFVLNHASVLSKQFKDLTLKGDESKYRDFFIDWNKFWQGYGKMSDEGYIVPDDKYIKDMFFRKPGLPILMVRFPDGRDVPYWNTFYQKVYEEDGERKYLGQMDLNINSRLVWEFYEETLSKLSDYGTSIVRLDAFAYAPKAPGRKNFLNDPETWDLLKKIDAMASKYNMSLLPEIHASYAEGIYQLIADMGYMMYDFFMPGLIIDALDNKDTTYLVRWIKEIVEKKLKTVNMLGCHDGIPVLDLKGLLSEERIEKLIKNVTDRGGYIKDLHGAKNIYYQINATYFSALGEDEKKMLMARALQIFTPGKPQVWYLDLLGGKNDYEAMKKAGDGGHKEINRTNYSFDESVNALNSNLAKKQLELLKLRYSHPAFNVNSNITVEAKDHMLMIKWQYDMHEISLFANLDNYEYVIK